MLCILFSLYITMEDPTNTKDETTNQCSKWCKPSTNKRTRWIQLVVVLGVLVAINLGVSAGVATSSNNDWLDTLNNPPFRPPGWLFAPVCMYVRCILYMWVSLVQMHSFF